MPTRSKSSSHQRPPLEVSILFDPHRRQHDLLQAAYASLVPPSRRRVPSGQEAARTPQSSDRCRERKAP
jgi:hypothetical protein